MSDLEKCLKIYTLFIFINIFVFNFGKFLFNSSLFILFLIGFFSFNLSNQSIIKNNLSKYLNNRRKLWTQLIRIEAHNNCDEIESDKSCKQFDQKSITSINTQVKPSLTESYLIDDQLHQIIELVIKDFVEEWYKKEISNTEEFYQLIKILIYNAIRQFNLCLKSIDWEYFITNLLANNLLIHFKFYNKSVKKLKKQNPNRTQFSSSNSQELYNNAKLVLKSNDNSLIENFFDLEADLEKVICRDNLALNLKDNELSDYLQELTDLLCFQLMSPRTFNCFILRCLIRDIFSNILIKTSIDKLTDPDYINQTILYLSQDFNVSTENFLNTINYSNSLDELTELRSELDLEISRTRSNDKGGQDDQEIKLKLSSLSFIKRRIDNRVSNLVKILNRAQTNENSIYTNNDDENKNYDFNLRLNSIELDTVIKNESIQHCFIEFMSKKNVQNLISFYLNADMYRQFAIKELSKLKNTTTTNESIRNTKESLRDFAKGLINSYLLSASNFKSSENEDEPANILNRVYYKKELNKAIDNLENLNNIDENLLNELQSKMYLLMKEKYYNDFKNNSEYHKILLKNDLIYTLSTSNSFIAEPSMMSNSTDELDSLEFSNEEPISITIDDVSHTYDLCSNSTTQQNDDPKTTRLSAVITSTGRCNELKTTYAIYIIDITRLNETTGKVDYWQTYRRFNDFHDFHLLLKKNFPNLNNLKLPGKSFRNSLNDDLIEKRILELNGYLQLMTNQETLIQNPGLLDLILKFLENRRWEFSSQTSIKRKFDSLFSPMLNSVQSIQTSIKNAPDNVIGMVKKGISDNILNEQSINSNNNNNNANNLTTESKQKENIDLNLDDMFNNNNLPIKVLMMLIDEVFDLKEKNQWLRQSLISIIKSILKNFKGDSMNRKIKEQIADYLGEESIARYLKNFRKRIWPKGLSSLDSQETTRSKHVKEITKILVKTKLLGFLSDEFKTILGNDTSREGLLNLFNLFQHKSLNKRFLYVLIENFVTVLFNNTNNTPSNIHSILPYLYHSPNSSNTSNQTQLNSASPSINSSPVNYLIRLHLSKSYRIKNEWKITKFNKNSPNLSLNPNHNKSLPNSLSRNFHNNLKFNLKSLEESKLDHENKDDDNNSFIIRSKSLYEDIKC